MKAKHRNMATLNLPKRVEAIVTQARAVVASMTDNPHFPSPVPLLWVVSQAVANLQDAETAARTRVVGAAAARDEKRTMLRSLLQQLRSYVQVTADADPENAVAIIESAGMAVKKEPNRAPRVFSAKPGAAPGEVQVVAPTAGNRASYDWQYSIDGGVDWLTLPSTLRASIKLEGLTPGMSVMVRYRSVTSKGRSDWSSGITLRMGTVSGNGDGGWQ